MPLASAAVGPQAAAPILLVIDGIAQLALLKNAWRQANRREVGIMAAGALVGIPLGVAILAYVDATTLRWAIAVLIVAMLALLISGWRYHGRPSTATTVGVGFSAGILSGAVQAAGPPVVAYWLGGNNSALTVRANIILFFFCTSVVAAISYLATGLLGLDVLLLSALTAPGYALGMFLGTRMFGHASDRMFRRSLLRPDRGRGGYFAASAGRRAALTPSFSSQPPKASTKPTRTCLACGSVTVWSASNTPSLYMEIDFGAAEQGDALAQGDRAQMLLCDRRADRPDRGADDARPACPASCSCRTAAPPSRSRS